MISQTAEYALRAVVYLAKQNGSPGTRVQISEGGLIPIDYLTRVMQALSEHNIVTIKRGPGGGYMIVPPKEKLTVLDVISAIETLPRLTQCPLGLPEHETLCPLHAKLDEATALVEKTFRETLVVDLINTRPKKRSGKNHCSFPE